MAKSEQINVYVAPELRVRVLAQAAKSKIPSESLMMAILAEEALDSRDDKDRKSK